MMIISDYVNFCPLTFGPLKYGKMYKKDCNAYLQIKADMMAL